MLIKIRLIVLIIISLLFNSFSCQPWYKYVRGQELILDPYLIYIEQNEVDLKLTIRIPSEISKKADSLQYRVTLGYETENEICNFLVNLAENQIVKGQKIEHIEHIKQVIPQSYLEDTTFVYTSFRVFKNDKKTYYLPDLEIGKIIKTRDNNGEKP